jgi:hypothetical protein
MIDDLDKKTETNALSNQQLDLKHYLSTISSPLEEKKLNGTNQLKLKTFWKVMTTPNISIWLLMVNTENNTSSN